MTISGVRLLVIEDEMLIALETLDVLREAGGVIVRHAARLDDACSAARELDVDLAVLDLNLYGESSEPVADILRQRAIPFLLLTGYSAALETRLGLRDAPRLVKPVKPADLISLAGRLAAGGRAR